jgi:hypothetical protein
MVTDMPDDPLNDYTWMEYITPINATDAQQPYYPYLASPKNNEGTNQNTSRLPVQFLLNLKNINSNTEGPLPRPRRFASSSD